MPLWPWQNRSSATTAAPLVPNRWRIAPSGVRTDRPRHFSVKNRAPSGATARSQGFSRSARMTVRWTRSSEVSAARAGGTKTRVTASSRIATSGAGVGVRCMVSSWVLGRATRPRVLRPRPSGIGAIVPHSGKTERTNASRAGSAQGGAAGKRCPGRISAPLGSLRPWYCPPLQDRKRGQTGTPTGAPEAAPMRTVGRHGDPGSGGGSDATGRNFGRHADRPRDRSCPRSSVGAPF